jgi:hypothetical protein
LNLISLWRVSGPTLSYASLRLIAMTGVMTRPGTRAVMHPPIQPPRWRRSHAPDQKPPKVGGGTVMGIAASCRSWKCRSSSQGEHVNKFRPDGWRTVLDTLGIATELGR